jgi:hypothetical protein
VAALGSRDGPRFKSGKGARKYLIMDGGWMGMDEERWRRVGERLFIHAYTPFLLASLGG